MAGLASAQGATPGTRRGHILEDAVTRYVREEVGLGPVVRGGTWRNGRRPWQVATPDRIAVYGGSVYPLAPEDLAIVEAKTAADWEPWGEEGTDEIPDHYRVQVVWQMDTLGIRRAYVGVLLPRLTFRFYEVTANPGEAAYLRQEARAFMRTLPRPGRPGTPPDVDEHGQTYVVLRELHPEIDRGRSVEVSRELAGEYVRAVQWKRDAGDAYQLATNRLAAAMGQAHRAVYGGQTVADRRSKNGGPPYVNPATRLPVITDPPAAGPECWCPDAAADEYQPITPGCPTHDPALN
jgi:hypothetical protein